MNLYLTRAGLQQPPSSSRRLKADEDDGVCGFGQISRQVMQHSSAGSHTACGDDDRRSLQQTQLLRSSPAMHETEIPGGELIPATLIHLLHLGIMILPVTQVESRCRGPHWRVYGNRKNRNLALFFQFAQVIDEQLCPANGKSRNDHFASTSGRVVDDLSQSLLGIRVVVNAVAV